MATDTQGWQPIETAFGVLSMTPPHFGVAKLCFTVAALLLALRIGVWLPTIGDPDLGYVKRILPAFVLFGAIGCLWSIALVWVARLETLPSAYHNAVKIVYGITKEDVTQPRGTIVAGIPWQNGFVVTTIEIKNTAPTHLANVEFQLRMNAPAFRVAQVTSVPNVYVTPINPAAASIADWEGGSLDKKGKIKKRVVPTPEQLQIVKDYAQTATFAIKIESFYRDTPIRFVVVGAGKQSYTVGPWTFVGRGLTVSPSMLTLEGSYDVTYGGRVHTLPIHLGSERLRQ